MNHNVYSYWNFDKNQIAFIKIVIYKEQQTHLHQLEFPTIVSTTFHWNMYTGIHASPLQRNPVGEQPKDLKSSLSVLML